MRYSFRSLVLMLHGIACHVKSSVCDLGVCQFTKNLISNIQAHVCSMNIKLNDACRSTRRSTGAMHGRCVPADVPQHHLLPRRLPMLRKLPRGAHLQLSRLLQLPAQHLPSRAAGARQSRLQRQPGAAAPARIPGRPKKRSCHNLLCCYSHITG